MSANIPKLINNGIEVSLFIDPVAGNIENVKKLGVKAIEIHTGSYANTQNQKNNIQLKKIKKIVKIALDNNISVRAGHGLTFENVKNIIKFLV